MNFVFTIALSQEDYFKFKLSQGKTHDWYFIDNNWSKTYLQKYKVRNHKQGITGWCDIKLGFSPSPWIKFILGGINKTLYVTFMFPRLLIKLQWSKIIRIVFLFFTYS